MTIPNPAIALMPDSTSCEYEYFPMLSLSFVGSFRSACPMCIPATVNTVANFTAAAKPLFNCAAVQPAVYVTFTDRGTRGQLPNRVKIPVSEM